MGKRGLNRKKIIFNIFMAAGIITLMMFMFRKDYEEILGSIRSVSVPGLLLIMGAGVGYQFWDAAMCYMLLHKKNPAFRYRQAVDLTFLGVFGNALTSSAGNIPLQSYYLHEHGVQIGDGVGLLALKYVFHKTAICLYAAIMVFTQRRWLQSTIPEAMGYIHLGMAVCVLIVVFLSAFFTWERVYKLLLYVIRKFPDMGKWKQWKISWSNQVEALYKESRTIVRDHSTCCKVMILNLLKLFWLYLTPFLCMEALKISNPGWGRIQALASIMLVIIGVLPNVAGMGPAEFAFLKLFTPYIGRVPATSSLVLYRAATYFFPVVISAGVTIKIQKELLS